MWLLSYLPRPSAILLYDLSFSELCFGLYTIMHAIVFSLDWCCLHPAVVMERLDNAAVT